MSLFFTPSAGADWAGATVTAANRPRLVRRLPQVRLGSAAVADADPAARWRAGFQSFRVRTVLSEIVISASPWGILLITEPTVASALAWGLVPAVCLPLAIAAAGGYRWRTLGEGAVEERLVVRAGAFVVFALVVLGYVGLLAVPTLLATAAVPAAVGGTLLARHVSHRSVLRRRFNGESMFSTLVLGSASAAQGLVSEIRRSPGSGYDVVGWAALPGQDLDAPAGVRSFGSTDTFEALRDVVLEHGIDVVILAGSTPDPDAARKIAWALEGTDAVLVVAPGIGEIASSRVRVRPTGDLWSIQLDIDKRRKVVRGKGLVDRALGAVLLAVASLVLVPIMVAVRLTSPGKALYKQQRVGKDGRLFTMWKIRSMYIDADARREALLREAADGNGLLFKMKADPRVTPIGRVLRRLSIDELPQLWNVVRGEMSIVGPRPALPAETAQYEGDEPRRLVVKPGLTGLWQVSGRSDLSRSESMRLDLRYVDNGSHPMDASILSRTFRAVFGGHGAY